ncbi:hypothetical protein VIGAN_11088700 [Vigna angularis var. angularis]|uniref:Uncharacterized protein n=1 Tax=Vigna angularis var. angularis TaxID=157739 RepID=A0A0S3T8R0_PHAAN|nr:hypothetical protein VIGAN_11088700 [Vigna angularis var. angularis]
MKQSSSQCTHLVEFLPSKCLIIHSFIPLFQLRNQITQSSKAHKITYQDQFSLTDKTKMALRQSNIFKNQIIFYLHNTLFTRKNNKNIL